MGALDKRQTRGWFLMPMDGESQWWKGIPSDSVHGMTLEGIPLSAGGL